MDARLDIDQTLTTNKRTFATEEVTRHLMSTLLQLLANYYKSVVESEHIYYDNVNLYASHSKGSSTGSSEPSSRVVEEMLLLQRQVSQLTADIQMIHRENDRLKDVQKTQRALMESKLNNSKKIIEKLKKEKDRHPNTVKSSSNTPPPIQLKKREQLNFHLLSPLNARKLEGAANQDDISDIPTSQKRSTRLRQVLTSGHQTLFDDDETTENLSVERTDDVVFINSLKYRDKLAKIILPSEGLSDNEESQERTSTVTIQDRDHKQGGQKKRKLARKRIQTVHTDNEE